MECAHHTEGGWFWQIAGWINHREHGEHGESLGVSSSRGG